LKRSGELSFARSREFALRVATDLRGGQNIKIMSVDAQTDPFASEGEEDPFASSGGEAQDMAADAFDDQVENPEVSSLG
jgi:hypothetical protein